MHGGNNEYAYFLVSKPCGEPDMVWAAGRKPSKPLRYFPAENEMSRSVTPATSAGNIFFLI
jgi:hypothetical protein